MIKIVQADRRMIQYPRFQLPAVYRGPKKFAKLKK
jgi:hypothetical protein